jgi:hypothetical protein
MEGGGHSPFQGTLFERLVTTMKNLSEELVTQTRFEMSTT